MSNIAILIKIELAFLSHTNVPSFKISKIKDSEILKAGKTFTSIDFIQKRASYNEKMTNTKGGCIYNKQIAFDVPGVNPDNIEKLQPFIGQKLVAKATDINGYIHLIYPLKLEFIADIPGEVRKTNKISYKLTGKTLHISPHVI